MGIGRNDPCPCGSGKKYKRCCMVAPIEPDKKPKMLNQVGLNRILYLMIKKAGGIVIYDAKELESSIDLKMNIAYNTEKDQFALTAVEPQKIITLPTRIIT